jgi:hypothetical protein
MIQHGTSPSWIRSRYAPERLVLTVAKARRPVRAMKPRLTLPKPSACRPGSAQSAAVYNGGVYKIGTVQHDRSASTVTAPAELDGLRGTAGHTYGNSMRNRDDMYDVRGRDRLSVRLVRRR